MAKERLDKLLSHEGFGSRKDIKKLLRTRTVLLNQNRIYDSSVLIDAENDEISIDGEKVDFRKHIYLMMNKPKHTVSSSKDGEHQTVFDLLDDNFFDYICYWNEKYFRNGFCDAVELISGCLR